MPNEECPRHCHDDRKLLHTVVDEIKKERKESWRKAGINVKWVIGILITILGAAFLLLWNGQRINATGISGVHKRITQDFGTLQKDMNEIAKIVIRIDERTKAQEKLEDKHHSK